jgi:hypothetical protein
MNGSHGSMGPPDVLPYGYGDFSGGEYGRLAVEPAANYITNYAPFRGPGGTTPFQRGDPNLPAHAPPIQETAGGVIPFSTLDAGVTNTSPQQPGAPYAVQYQMAGPSYNGLPTAIGGLRDGLGYTPTAPAWGGPLANWRAKQAAKQAVASQAPSSVVATFRDVNPPGDPFYYRQYADGSIEVLAPSPSLVGEVLTPTNQWSANWRAVTNMIGPFPALSAGGAAGGNPLASQALSLLSSFAQNLPGTAQAAPAAPANPNFDPNAYGPPAPPPTAPGIPTWALVAGGVAVLGGAVYLIWR